MLVVCLQLHISRWIVSVHVSVDFFLVEMHALLGSKGFFIEMRYNSSLRVLPEWQHSLLLVQILYKQIGSTLQFSPSVQRSYIVKYRLC